MRYDINEFVDHKNLLYRRGVLAIEKRDLEALKNIISDENFDYASSEARALLFSAAQNCYLKAFQLLGDAKVPLFYPLKVLNKREHILSYADCGASESVFITQDETPLHTLLRHLNLRMFSQINLEEHFSKADIQDAINTYSINAQGTPLDIAWNNHLKASSFLIEQAIKNEEHIFTIPPDFYSFCDQILPLIPDLTIHQMVEKPMLYQQMIYKKDYPSLIAIATPMVFTLNYIGYKFPKSEYDALYPWTEPEVAEQMLKGFTEPVIKKQNFLSKILDKIDFRNRQRN